MHFPRTSWPALLLIAGCGGPPPAAEVETPAGPSVAGAEPAEAPTADDAETPANGRLRRSRWVASCLADFETIQPGMTRAEVEETFPADGGFSTPDTGRYVHPECPYFKIDVHYLVSLDADGRGTWSDSDRVESAPRPYLEHPFYD